MVDPKQLIIVKNVRGERYAQNIRVRQHVLYADEPEALGGRDLGPGPFEFLLAALGACTAMALKGHALRRGLDLRCAAVELRHETQNGNGVKLDYFHRVIHLEGDLTDDGRGELLRAAEQCPVSRTLRKSSVVETELAGPTGLYSDDISEMPATLFSKVTND